MTDPAVGRRHTGQGHQAGRVEGHFAADHRHGAVETRLQHDDVGLCRPGPENKVAAVDLPDHSCRSGGPSRHRNHERGTSGDEAGHRAIHREHAPREGGRGIRQGHAVIVDSQLAGSQCDDTPRQTRGSRRIRHSDQPALHLPNGDAQHARVDMHTVCDHLHRQPRVRQRNADKPRPTMVKGRHGVEEMGHVPSTRIDRGQGRHQVRLGMADRGDDSSLRHRRDHVQRTDQLGSERDHPDHPGSSTSERLQLAQAGRTEVLHVMGPRPLGSQPRTFKMGAQDLGALTSTSRFCDAASNSPKRLPQDGQRVGNGRGEQSRRPVPHVMASQSPYGIANLSRILAVDLRSGSTVDV